VPLIGELDLDPELVLDPRLTLHDGAQATTRVPPDSRACG
jgi:hypothetical protein